MLSQYTQTQIDQIIANVATLGATHVEIFCPLDEYSDYAGTDPVSGYIEKWLTPIRAKGLKVYWRGTWTDFEGIYSNTKATPTGTPSRALGALATVLSGADTTSYLAKTYAHIKLKGRNWFKSGDAFGVMPQPDNQGIGAGTSNMFSSAAVLGQWLVDLKQMADYAFERHLGYAHEEILTGMTSVLGATLVNNTVTSTYWKQLFRVCIDYYLTSGTYSTNLNTADTNSGGADIYITEYGTTSTVGSPGDDSARSALIEADFTTFASKTYIKGVTYLQPIGTSGAATEAFLNYTSYGLDQPLTIATIRKWFVSQKQAEGFVESRGARFYLGSERLRGIWGNFYKLNAFFMDQSSVADFFAKAKALKIRVIRTWAFDVASDGYFHRLGYPVNTTNLLPTANDRSFETGVGSWVLGSDTARTSGEAHDGTYSIVQTSTYGTYEANYIPISGLTQNAWYIWTFWYKVQALAGDGGHFPPTIRIQDSSGTDFVDANILNAPNTWQKRQVRFNTGARTSIRLAMINFGGQNISKFDDMHFGADTTPVLESIEEGYTQMDMVIEEARKADIKLILSFHDDNENNYNSKRIYLNWINATMPGKNLPTGVGYGEFNSPSFYTDSDMIALEEAHMAELINRVSTISGIANKNNKAIFSWELGNEPRYNQFGANDAQLNSEILGYLSTAGGWTDNRSRYIRSLDPNHMIGFGGTSHGYEYWQDANANQDWVHNGTYPGVDDIVIGQLREINYLDPHCYPTQNLGSDIHNYGIKYGHIRENRGQGLDRQITEWVKNAKLLCNKPFFFGEYGYERDYLGDDSQYNLTNRLTATKRSFNAMINADGDGMCLWHLETSDSNSFTINIANTWDSNTTNVNFDDRPFCTWILAMNNALKDNK